MNNKPTGKDSFSTGRVILLALILLWLIWFEHNIASPYTRYSKMLAETTDIMLDEQRNAYFKHAKQHNTASD